jgi:hypothetical protein
MINIKYLVKSSFSAMSIKKRRETIDNEKMWSGGIFTHSSNIIPNNRNMSGRNMG